MRAGKIIEIAVPCLILVVVLAIALGGPGPGSAPDLPPEGAATDGLRGTQNGQKWRLEDAEWLEAAQRHSARVRFARDNAPEGDAELQIQTLGPLHPEGKERLLRHMQGLWRAALDRWERAVIAPGHGPDGAKTLADVERELQLLLFARRYEAALDMIESGEYLTLSRESGDVDKVRLGPNHLVTKVYNVAKLEGKAVDSLIAVPVNDHRVQPTHDELRLFTSLRIEEDIQAFNERPLEERRERIEKHFRAMDEIQRIRASVSDAAARRSAIEPLLHDLLPASWKLSRGSYYAMPRGR